MLGLISNKQSETPLSKVYTTTHFLTNSGQTTNSNTEWHTMVQQVQNVLFYLGCRSKVAGPEEAGRRGAKHGGVGDASSCRALMVDGLVGGDHGCSQLEAAVVTVVLHQGQRVFLLCGPERWQFERGIDSFSGTRIITNSQVHKQNQSMFSNVSPRLL